MAGDLTILPEQHQKLERWLSVNGELFVDVHLIRGGCSSINYFVRSVKELQQLMNAQTWPGLVVTVFRQLQFPIRGIADETLLKRALDIIPDGRDFSILRLDDGGYYPDEVWCRASGQGHAELQHRFPEVLGELIAIGEHPFDGDTSWFKSNPNEALVFERVPPWVSGSNSMADILGPWEDPNFDSNLIVRCREAWNKPLRELSRKELTTFLQQDFAVTHVLPIAKAKLLEPDDDTEFFDGELAEAIERAIKST